MDFGSVGPNSKQFPATTLHYYKYTVTEIQTPQLETHNQTQKINKLLPFDLHTTLKQKYPMAYHPQQYFIPQASTTSFRNLL